MPFKEQMRKMKANYLLENEKNFQFHQMLKALRKLSKKSRKTVAEDTLISENQIVYLESGRVKTPPDRDILFTLSQYYEFPYELLKDKAKEFVILNLINER